MTFVNQNDEPVVETELFQPGSNDATKAQIEETIRILLKYFNLEVWETNATKHGNTELELREVQ